VQIYQSMQSGVGKLSCNKTALKRCTSTGTLWNRKLAPSLSSPEYEEIFLPKLPKSWHADVFKCTQIIIIIFLAHQHKTCRQLKIKQEMTAWVINYYYIEHEIRIQII